MNEARKQQYFAELAPQYSHLTGNTTQDIFAKFLASNDIDLTADSIVHDNAAGPGTATQVLVERATATSVVPTIIATDYASGMIEALEKIRAAEIKSSPAWDRVTAKVVDSSDLSAFKNDYFTHSISNFSLFTITNAVQSLKETRRTLKTGGKAYVLLWKRYPVQDLLAAAQDLVQGEGYAKKNAVPVNGPQYFAEGVVAKQLVEAGFEESKVETIVVDYTLEEGQKWDGLFTYLTGSSIAEGSTKGWTEEQSRRWPEAVRQAMAQEKAKHGGIYCEAWVTTATK